VLAAFYIPSMPANLLERHGLDRGELAPVVDAFAAGEVERALELTPEAVVDALSVAGTPEDWVERLRRDVLPTGVDHLLVSFADPFTVRSWSGRDVEGVPDLAGQLRLFSDEVVPALS
jgi:5,10-methylenetetrahydromethanopterin reductase